MKKIICAIITAALIMPAASLPTAAASEDDELVTFIVETSFMSAAELETTISIAEEHIIEDTVLKNERIRDELARALDADITHSCIYAYADSGFTITARRGDMDRLLAAKGVTAVYEDGELFSVPDDEPAEGDVQNIADTAAEYKGQGTLIAVIDSGFELSHPYFDAEVDSARYSQSDIEAIIRSKLGGRGRYYSEKIPFVYNYKRSSSTEADIAYDGKHGTHVAGIAAGKNGDIGDGYVINGAAPEAQLALMACSNGGGRFSWSVLKLAVDDAAALGADVINMSIGSPYADIRNGGYTSLKNSIANARKKGVTVCVSQGNSSIGLYGSAPLAANVDYSTSGMMANITDTFSTASADSYKYYKALVNITAADGTVIQCATVNAADGVAAFDTTFTAQTEYVHCGLGAVSDFSAKNVKGKIALIRRGSLSFEEKTRNAKNAGAVGAIMYDNIEEDYPATQGYVLPSIFIKKADGEALAEMETKTIYVSGYGVYQAENKTTPGKPSSFTSWGFSETMQLTPCITAYGGNVYSSVPGGKYNLLSGTSMASPYIAGASAAVKSYLNSKPFSGTENVGSADLIQQLLMTTAVPIAYTDTDILYSPRLQGAGMVDTQRAMESPVTLYNSNNKTLINLGDGIDNRFTLSFTAHNYSDADISFDNVSVFVTTDAADSNGYVAGTQRLTVTDMQYDSVNIDAGGDAVINISVTLDSAELARVEQIFTNGFYIDGFVRLSNNEYSAGIPFSGFRGNWSAVPIWDKTAYDNGGSVLTDAENKIKGTYLTTKEGSTVLTFGTGTKYNIISPADKNGKFDTLSALFAMYRSCHSVSLGMVRNGNETVLRTIGDYIFKFTQHEYPITGNDTEYARLAALPDGNYTLRLTGRFNDGKKDAAQSLDFPLSVTIDNTPPSIAAELSEDKNTLYVTAADANYLRSITVSYTDLSGVEHSETVSLDNTKISYTHEFMLDNAELISVAALDYAYNIASSEIPLSETVRTEYSQNKLSYSTGYSEQKHGFDMYAALYNSSGVLKSVLKNCSAGEFDAEEGDTVKVFFWKDMMPVYQ